MSQYCSRIHIKVKEPNIWKRFENKYDTIFNLDNFITNGCCTKDENKTSFIINGDWGYTEDEIKEIVVTLSKILDKDGIIIADTTNINVDPADYCVYYFGDKVRTKLYEDIDDYDDEESDRENLGIAEMLLDTDIGDIIAWLNCADFTLSEVEKNQLKDFGFVIDNNKKTINVTPIEDFAFEGCSSLKEIHIPNSITEIGVSAFEGCSSLEKIHIPDSVTKIGDFAFKDCTSLKEVNIPDSVTKIGKSAFANCISLKEK